MTRPAISVGRLLAASALFAAPSVVILLALAGLGRIGAGTALAAAAAAAAATGAIVYGYHREAVRLAGWLDRLGRTEDDAVPPPRPATALGRALVGALSRLQRGWRARSGRMAAELAGAAAILEAFGDPLVVVDDGRRVVRANGAARALFGARMAGRDLAEHLRHPTVLAAVDAVLAGGGARSVEIVQAVPVERVFAVRVARFDGGAPEAGGPGDGVAAGAPMPGALVTCHDITAIKRSEQMRADFVANASHELRTPLATLTGFIETLRGPARDDPEARDRFLAIMHEQAGRMARLVGDLLSLSRIELDEHTPPAGTVDLLGVLRGVIATLEIAAGQRGLRLRLAGPAALPAVPGDPDQLAQVFQNLIDNAVKYARPNTEIVVSVSRLEAGPGRPGPHLAVAVRDRGEGIDKAHLPRLTERFYRADPARSRAMGGTGLGLAIVKHVVNRHRGRLLIESEPGAGSTFTVLLPMTVRPGGAERVGAPAAHDV